MQLILASQSNARKKLLEDVGLIFRVVTSTVNEDAILGKTHEETIRLRAKLKGEDVAKNLQPKTFNLEPVLILSADSGVILGKEHFEKPRDFNDGVRILTNLSGKTHKLYTAFQLIKTDGKGKVIEKIQGDDASSVTFYPITQEQIVGYLTNNPDYLKYAGGYAISSASDRFIRKIEGSVTNVIGLPMEKITPVFSKFDLIK